MSPAIYWLVLSILLSLAMWLPYVLRRVGANGLMPSLGYDFSTPEASSWAARAKKAHLNATENLVLFAPLVLIAELITPANGDAAIGTAAMVYFVARLLHYICYTLGIPVARTLTFFAGWLATLFIALRILGLA